MNLKKPKPFPDFTSEASLGFSASARSDFLVIGVDEVGRGCLAGPVVAAAAALTPEALTFLPFDLQGARLSDRDATPQLICDQRKTLWRVRDSKLIPEPERPIVRDAVKAFVLGHEVAEASVAEINELNILWASHLAMERAVQKLESRLGREADLILIDGHMVPKKFKSRGMNRAVALVKGDLRSFTIACASIIAKTYRDDLMVQLEEQYPGYGLKKHKGYPTPFHKQQILKQGVTPLHRMGFKGCEIESNEKADS